MPLILYVLFIMPFAFAQNEKALIYTGIGSCEVLPQPDGTVLNELCSTAFKSIAKNAGFEPIEVGPQALNELSSPEKIASFFAGVKVWIQPGGSSKDLIKTMNPVLLSALRNYIFKGGGYVGIGAGGGTFATENYFAIFPASAASYESKERTPGYFKRVLEAEQVIYSCSLENIVWEGRNRRIYFQYDPYFILKANVPRVEIIARYPDGKIAAARSKYGKGKVFISGVSPEAPLVWSEVDGMVDSDGLDHDLAEDMLRWVAQ